MLKDYQIRILREKYSKQLDQGFGFDDFVNLIESVLDMRESRDSFCPHPPSAITIDKDGYEICKLCFSKHGKYNDHGNGFTDKLWFKENEQTAG